MYIISIKIAYYVYADYEREGLSSLNGREKTIERIKLK